MWRRFQRQEGITLAELLVSLATLGVVLVLLVGFLVRLQGGMTQAGGRGEADQTAQQVLDELGREIRSGGVVLDPAVENDATHDLSAGMALRLYTQAGSESGIGPRCVQWRVTSDRELQRRDWSLAGGSPSAWRVVAEPVVNRTLSPQVPAFSLAGADAGDLYGHRVVDINLVLGAEGAGGGTVSFQGSVAGRNPGLGGTNSACSNVPTS